MRTTLRYFICLLSIVSIFTSCQKELSMDGGIVLPGGGTTAGTAVFSLAGSPGACTSPAISGGFVAGKVTDTSNWVTANVNVDTMGTYTITTNTANGISFSVTDSFIAVGQQTIKLRASGTPLAGGTFTFNLGTGGCSFPVTFTGGTTPPPQPPAGDCKECGFVPVCVGSKYTYTDSTYGVVSERSIEFTSSTDTVIDGKTYTKVVQNVGQPGYYNCTDGETTVIGYELVSAGGNLLKEYKSIMIKANAAVGTVWDSNVTNPAGQVVTQKFTVKSKGISRTVGTFNFTDIIVIQLETGIEMPGGGIIPAAFSEYYYANGVGLIEVITQDVTSGMVIYHSVVKSYFIP